MASFFTHGDGCGVVGIDTCAVGEVVVVGVAGGDTFGGWDANESGDGDGVGDRLIQSSQQYPC